MLIYIWSFESIEPIFYQCVLTQIGCFSLKLPPPPHLLFLNIHTFTFFEGKHYLVQEYTLPPAVVHPPGTPDTSLLSMYCWRFPRPGRVWYVCSLETIKIRSYLRSKFQFVLTISTKCSKCRHASSRMMENKLTFCIVSIVWVAFHSQGFIKFCLGICVHCVHISSFFFECLSSKRMEIRY